MDKVHLSIVTPAYKCADCIVEMHRRLTEALSKITPDYEIIFVDDGSPQNDWELIYTKCAAFAVLANSQLKHSLQGRTFILFRDAVLILQYPLV